MPCCSLTKGQPKLHSPLISLSPLFLTQDPLSSPSPTTHPHPYGEQAPNASITHMLLLTAATRCWPLPPPLAVASNPSSLSALFELEAAFYHQNSSPQPGSLVRPLIPHGRKTTKTPSLTLPFPNPTHTPIPHIQPRTTPSTQTCLFCKLIDMWWPEYP